MTDFMMGAIIAGWLVSAILGWWLMVRYYNKRLDIIDLILGIPISFIAGPVLLGISIALIISNLNSKPFKEWK